MKIFSAEHFGAVHETLRGLPGYSWSRYSGSEHQSGEVVNGHPHQDLMATSFPDNHFDIVLTSDVMEHIPEPYLAHGEIYRILKPGGVHIFTVPCSLNNPIDDQRAAVVNGKLLYLAPPEWHGEPTDSNLVYTIFGLEMVCHLWTLGFRALIHESSDPEKGIIGFNAVAFEAVKHHDPLSREVPMGLRSKLSQ
jgi:SAM-dependent methyltransferase